MHAYPEGPKLAMCNLQLQTQVYPHLFLLLSELSIIFFFPRTRRRATYLCIKRASEREVQIQDIISFLSLITLLFRSLALTKPICQC
jgi:hypothetical protein